MEVVSTGYLPFDFLAGAGQAEGDGVGGGDGGVGGEVVEVEADGGEGGGEEVFHGGPGGGEGGDVGGEEDFFNGEGAELEGGGADDAEAVAGSDEEFEHVVAGYVLHHAPAGMGDATVGKHCFQSDEVLTDGPEAAAPRAEEVFGEELADRDAFRVGRVNGEPLAMSGEGGLEGGEGEAAFGGDGHVLGGVFADGGEGGEVNGGDGLPRGVGLGEEAGEVGEAGGGEGHAGG